MKKIEIAKELIRSNTRIFRCPLCSSKMELHEPHSLVCQDKHNFDLARNGYCSLLPGSTKSTKYDKAGFESRRTILQSGFFGPLVTEIVAVVNEFATVQNKRHLDIIDIGCGEGSHLADVVHALQQEDYEILGVGIDIAREGVYIAAREYPGLIWCVADLARSPFASKQFDVLLNIFSPSNYSEFQRILRDDGIIIKVIPGSEYLQELREVLYHGTAREAYSNEDVVDLFAEHLQVQDQRKVCYSQELRTDDLAHLLKMTPLAWGAPHLESQNKRLSSISHVTVDVTILIGNAN